MFAATNRYMILPYFASLAMRSNSQEMLALHHDLFLGASFKVHLKERRCGNRTWWLMTWFGSLPPENGLLRRGDSGKEIARFFQVSTSQLSWVLLQYWSGQEKIVTKMDMVGHWCKWWLSIFKYQIMIYCKYDTSTCGNFPTQENGVVFTTSNIEHWHYSLTKSQGFNLILRSRDNMQIWWRHIRRNLNRWKQTNKSGQRCLDVPGVSGL